MVTGAVIGSAIVGCPFQNRGIALAAQVPRSSRRQKLMSLLWSKKGGSRVSARAGKLETCGSSVGQYPAPYDDYGYCQATNADGAFVGCFFFDPEYFDVIASINAYSFIRFGFDGGLEEFSNCTFLVVTAKSAYLPFTPIEKDKVK